MIDDELSRAVVAYIRGAGLAWPHRSLDAVAGAMGADAAERLGPHLKRLADEAVYWPVDWNRKDAALYDLPPEQTGRRGRPRAKSARLRSLAKLAHGVTFAHLTVTRYGKTATIQVGGVTCL